MFQITLSQIWKLSQQVLALEHHLLHQRFNKLQVLAWDLALKKTMMLAQRLYEAGYITYMRTDSTNLSQDALNMARSYIENHFGAQYLPEKPNFYSSKENAQEAHEAIRPSDIRALPESLREWKKRCGTPL